jgi:hypothetical protein
LVGVAVRPPPACRSSCAGWARGLGVFWDKTNLKAVAQPARNAEWGAELYYNYALFKALWVTPDIQLYFDPARLGHGSSSRSPAASTSSPTAQAGPPPRIAW